MDPTAHEAASEGTLVPLPSSLLGVFPPKLLQGEGDTDKMEGWSVGKDFCKVVLLVEDVAQRGFLGKRLHQTLLASRLW